MPLLAVGHPVNLVYGPGLRLSASFEQVENELRELSWKISGGGASRGPRCNGTTPVREKLQLLYVQEVVTYFI